MDIDERIELVNRFPTVETITEEELRFLFETRKTLKHYIGFEISGKVHLGTGLMTAMKIRQLQKAGIKTTVFLADYHAWINNKLGGNIERIQKVAKEYFMPAMKTLGLENSDFVLASEVYDQEYWKTVIKVSKSATMNRMLRCITIMGRKEEELSDCSAIFYPAMQTADILHLDVDIMHGGMDQRKVHMLYRDIREKMGDRKRVAIHTKLLMSLQGPKRMGHEEDEEVEISNKMSKSNPMSCIFIHDPEEEIIKKIKNAYCPVGDPANPVVELAEVLINLDGKLNIERKPEYGGDLEFLDAAQLVREFTDKKLHPMDLKGAVARELAKVLEPSRKYFEDRQETIRMVEQ